MSAADDQNAAITTPERRNNSGIPPSDAGCPAGWGWGSAIRSLVANNPTTPTTAMAAAIISTVATAATTEPVATTGAVYYHSNEDNITDEENGDDEPWVLRQITFLGLTAPNQPDGESLAPPEEDSANKPNEQLDARNLAEFLIEIGACSVSVIDADANTSNEDPLFDEPTLTACPNDFLADNHDDEEDGEDISKYAMVFKDAAVGRNLWKRCHLSAHFPYAASVINKGKDREYVQIQLEGGIAFGMGEHPTTRLA
eukprot:g7960.t1 g7960   contig26:657492-658335(-)